MPLSSTDIETWENDPENWLIEEAADAYEFKLRVSYHGDIYMINRRQKN
jgi:hypothetical protein